MIGVRKMYSRVISQYKLPLYKQLPYHLQTLEEFVQGAEREVASVQNLYTVAVMFSTKMSDNLTNL